MPLRWLISFVCSVVAVALLSLTPAVPTQASDAPPLSIFSSSAGLNAFDSLPDCGFGALVPDGVTVGAVIVNLETGAGCIENAATRFPVASIGKVFVLGAYLEMVMTGRSDYGRRMEFTDRYLMGGRNDCLSDQQVGTLVSRGSLSEMMIACSDNAATWMLMDTIGWDTVTRYVASVGLADEVGTVIPYSEVDRLKLALIDPRWQDVPRQFASRYLRRRETTGLSAYFGADLPSYSRPQMIDAASRYFELYDTNTATPRALAAYLLRLRDDLVSDRSPDRDVARAFFNTLMLTPRLYSTQAFPGTVYLGAKNGFDTGMTAEISFTLNSLDNLNRVPESLVIVFTRQADFNRADLQTPGQSEGTLNRTLRGLSPRIVEVLYPAYTEPELTPDPRLTTLRLQTSDIVNECWESYRASGYDPARVDGYEACLNTYRDRTGYNRGDRLALGMILREVNRDELRVTFVYVLPNGTRRSYQTESFYQPQVGFNWFHPIQDSSAISGEWTIEVYINLRLVARRSVFVG